MMQRHREQEEMRRQPDGFKPNYADNVSSPDRHANMHTQRSDRFKTNFMKSVNSLGEHTHTANIDLHISTVSITHF